MPRPRSHAIRPGDTLSRIARQHGTTPAALASLNGIKDPDRISSGDTLALPPAPAPGSAPPAAAQAKPAVPKGARQGSAAGRKSAATKSDEPPSKPAKSCPLDKKEWIKTWGTTDKDGVSAAYAEAGTHTTKGRFQSHHEAGLLKVEKAGTLENVPLGGSFNAEVFTGRVDTDLQISKRGGSAKAGGEVRVGKFGMSGLVGSDVNNPTAELGLEGEMATAELKGGVLVGDTDGQTGLGVQGSAGAALFKGDVSGEMNMRLGDAWKTGTIGGFVVSGVAKLFGKSDWTLSARGKVGGELVAVGGGGKAYMYRDKRSRRVHAGVGGKLAALVGIEADVDLSIGPPFDSRDRSDGI